MLFPTNLLMEPLRFFISYMRVLKFSHFKVSVTNPELKELRPGPPTNIDRGSFPSFFFGGFPVKHLGSVVSTTRPLAFDCLLFSFGLLSFRAAKGRGGLV